MELMQTDDVSTIAAQIANQAELIYQAWKTTDLNPSELIHYHSVNTERSSPLHPSVSIPTSPLSPSLSLGRTPTRSPSPSPLGTTPAVPRRVVEIPISSPDRAPAHPTSNHPLQQHPQSPSSPAHKSHQQIVVEQHNHAPSPSRSLNASPRPYISPTTTQAGLYAVSPGDSSPGSPRVIYSSSPSPGSLSSQRPSTSQNYASKGTPPPQQQPQPPPPPERSSSYMGSDPSASPAGVLQQPVQQQHPSPGVLGQSDLEASLRELVNNFVQEDKARHSKSRNSPSPIQDALQRFERQAAITSRASSPAREGIISRGSPTPSGIPHSQMSNNCQFSPTSTAHSPSATTPKYSPTAKGNAWPRRDQDSARSRRSISPSPPPISQPGWNESSQGNTSTWPLKNKQPPTNVTDKRSASPVPDSSNKTISTSSTGPTNYITTLETRVDGSGRSPSVPIRHKVIAMPASSKEEERLIQALRQGTYIDDGDSLRPVPGSQPASGHLGNSSPVPLMRSDYPSPSKCAESVPPPRTGKPKFSISVTVDVENKLTPSESSGGSSGKSSPSSPMWQGPPPTGQMEQLSNVDYAKVRFHDAQQRPKTTQRMEDYKSYSAKPSVNGDGRVMQARNRFEGSTPPPTPEIPWRTSSALTGVEMGGNLPEFYRRKLRKLRKSGSPEPFHALAATLPHPQLTDQQKAHIRERSQSPTGALASSIAIRPFLTQGSVAERVLLFEKAPTELKKTANTVLIPDKKRPAFSSWRDPDEVRTKAQDLPASPPSPPLIANSVKQLEAAPTSSLANSTSPLSSSSSTPLNATATAAATVVKHLQHQQQGQLRGDGSPSSPPGANKENARPSQLNQASPVSPLSPSSTPVSPLSSGGSGIPSTEGSSPVSSTIGGHNPPLVSATQGHQSPRTAGRRLGKTPKNLLIPRFYYPMGRPIPQTSQEQHLQRVSQCFRENGGQITKESMELLTRACQVPLYWKAPLFHAAGGEKVGYLTQEQFTDYWNRVIGSCHDASSRFVRILSRGLRNYLLPEDFLSLIQDVVDTHPGLTFLKEATEFHSRYVHTVIARIYYCVNRSWSGRITVPELRRSNLLQVISYLEEEEDINKITDYFSYEHFYVIYCKFWELDTDHDLFIDKHDLAKHNDRALSWRIIERIFSGAVTRGRVQKQDRMGYQEFVWFLISEEDKRHPTAIEYWFRCMDLDGDGYLSMYELEYFYEEQLQRMEALGEILPFTDCLCQMLDMVRPEEGNKISLSDLKKCRMTPVFFDTFFNLEKYLDHEQRDPFASHRIDDEGTEMSDWDKYAAEEYELLVAEEGGGDQQDDMLYCEDDELSMGVDNILEGGEDDIGIDSNHLGLVGDIEAGLDGVTGNGYNLKGSLRKHSPLSATVTNLALDHPMDVDEDYEDYADSDDYQY